MIPIIYVFNSGKSGELLEYFKEYKFYPYVNYNCDYKWFKENIIGPHRLYSIYDKLYEYQLSDIPNETDFVVPFFMICFSEEIGDDKWAQIRCWLEAMDAPVRDGFDISFLDTSNIQKKTNDYISDVVYVDEQGEGRILSIPPDDYDFNAPYEFRFRYNEAIDTMFYEVKRPGTEIPYTVVVVGYQKKGHVYFFTDIYRCNSWDSNRIECKYDFPFLISLWKHLDLKGEFTMQVLKDRIDRCYPEKLLDGIVPEAEPIVYRMSLDVVYENFCLDKILDIKPKYLK